MVTPLCYSILILCSHSRGGRSWRRGPHLRDEAQLHAAAGSEGDEDEGHQDLPGGLARRVGNRGRDQLEGRPQQVALRDRFRRVEVLNDQELRAGQCSRSEQVSTGGAWSPASHGKARHTNPRQLTGFQGAEQRQKWSEGRKVEERERGERQEGGGLTSYLPPNSFWTLAITCGAERQQPERFNAS